MQTASISALAEALEVLFTYLAVRHPRARKGPRLWLPGGQQPQFRRPVRERQAQSLDVRMAGAKASLGFRDLPAAARDSCGHLLAFLSFIHGSLSARAQSVHQLL